MTRCYSERGGLTMDLSNVSFSTVSERDMDMLFANALCTYPGFINLFLDAANINTENVEVNSVSLSKTEAHLGESDITVILTLDGIKYGFLIEDKIDAIAMPNQHERYIKRAEKGIKSSEYEKYEIFIVCPQKYYDIDEEAKKYEHFVSYEKCKKFFNSIDSVDARLKALQVSQAIEKSHKPPQVIINENANAFFRKYKQYQETHYEELSLRTRETSNGYWAHYNVNLKNAYIHHKIPQGYVDLTLKKAADKIDDVRILASWLNAHGYANVKGAVITNSASLRIIVPKLNMQNAFESVSENELKQCFEALKTLTEIASKLENIRKICEINN